MCVCVCALGGEVKLWFLYTMPARGVSLSAPHSGVYVWFMLCVRRYCDRDMFVIYSVSVQRLLSAEWPGVNAEASGRATRASPCQPHLSLNG